MPTVEELERLDALVPRLIRLSNLRPGELIRAQDWNDIVGVLIEVTRAVLAADQNAVVPPHEHPDQVAVGWLDPRLRALIERGSGAEPDAAGKLNTLDRRVERLNLRLEDLVAGIGDVRGRINDVVTRDLTRESEVTTVRRKIEGMGDSRDDILGMRETLQSLQKDLGVAVDLSTRLQVNGQPVDMTLIDRPGSGGLRVVGAMGHDGGKRRRPRPGGAGSRGHRTRQSAGDRPRFRARISRRGASRRGSGRRTAQGSGW